MAGPGFGLPVATFGVTGADYSPLFEQWRMRQRESEFARGLDFRRQEAERQAQATAAETAFDQAMRERMMDLRSRRFDLDEHRFQQQERAREEERLAGIAQPQFGGPAGVQFPGDPLKQAQLDLLKARAGKAKFELDQAMQAAGTLEERRYLQNLWDMYQGAVDDGMWRRADEILDLIERASGRQYRGQRPGAPAPAPGAPAEAPPTPPPAPAPTPGARPEGRWPYDPEPAPDHPDRLAWIERRLTEIRAKITATPPGPELDDLYREREWRRKERDDLIKELDLPATRAPAPAAPPGSPARDLKTINAEIDEVKRAIIGATASLGGTERLDDDAIDALYARLHQLEAEKKAAGQRGVDEAIEEHQGRTPTPAPAPAPTDDFRAAQKETLETTLSKLKADYAEKWREGPPGIYPFNDKEIAKHTEDLRQMKEAINAIEKQLEDLDKPRGAVTGAPGYGPRPPGVLEEAPTPAAPPALPSRDLKTINAEIEVVMRAIMAGGEGYDVDALYAKLDQLQAEKKAATR